MEEGNIIRLDKYVNHSGYSVQLGQIGRVIQVDKGHRLDICVTFTEDEDHSIWLDSKCLTLLTPELLIKRFQKQLHEL